MIGVIAIRCNFGSDYGLGHLKRCIRLANQLISAELECIFLTDSSVKTALPDFTGRNIALGEMDNFELESFELFDAARCVQKLEKLNVALVIVDDYRFGSEWHAVVRAKLNCKIAVIDDLARDNAADVIIDPKFTRSKIESRYSSEKLKYCQHLLVGPKFSIIDCPDQTTPHPLKSTPQIIISLGGGGDWRIVKDLVMELSRLGDHESKCDILAIIGPLATNFEYVLQLNESESSSVRCVVAPDSIVQYLMTASLYIGAAGTILYEVMAAKLPAITFEIADNQSNELRDLELLGHYFHIGKLQDSDASKICQLSRTLISNRERVASLIAGARVTVDWLGVRRVAKAIINCLLQKTDCPKESTKISNSCVIQSNVEDPITGLVALNDTHINRYLRARNLSQNRNKMTIQSEIQLVDHWIWWYKTKREKFEVKGAKGTAIYLWHEITKIEGYNYLVGGWFATGETDLIDVSIGLTLQLELTDNKYPGVPWLAVIHNDNNFTQLISERMGFKSFSWESLQAQRCLKYFKMADPVNFKFFMR